MTGDSRQRTTRRTVLGVAGSVAVAGLAGCVSGDDDGDDGGDTAGSDDSTDDGSSSETTGSASVTLLAERTSAHEEGLPDDNISHACEHFEFGDTEEKTGAETADGAPEISATHQLFDVTIEGDGGYVVFHAEGDNHGHEGEEGEGNGHDHEGEEGEGNGHDHEGEEGEGNGHDHEGEEGEGNGHDHEDEGSEGNGHDHEGEEGEHGGDAFAFFVDGGSATVVEGNTVHEENGDVPACGPADMYVLAEPHEDDVVLELSA
jgi:hypothetical protein